MWPDTGLALLILGYHLDLLQVTSQDELSSSPLFRLPILF